MPDVTSETSRLLVEWWPTTKPIPYATNPRVISDAAVQKVALSIEQYGWRQPIVVDEAGVIIAGHTRLRAALKLGRDEVPMHVASGLSDAQVKGLRLMDNRSSEESGWDDGLLVAELDELLGLDFDIAYAGFEEDLEEVLASGDALGLAGHGADDADEVPAVEAFPVSRPGDLWICGPHRVLCGNSTLPNDVALLLGGGTAAMCFTDPPFNVAIGKDSNPKHRQRRGLVNDDLPDEDFAFYAVVKLTNGGTLMKVMRRAEVDDVRDRFAPKTKAGKIVDPWTSDYEAMGRKTVLIQALKLAPKESERLQMALQAETDAIFGDRLAAGVVDSGRPVADRVAERIGVAVDPASGEVLDGEASEEPDAGACEAECDDEVPFAAPDSPTAGDGEEEPPGRGPRSGGVTPIRPPAATQAQLASITKLRKASGIYEAEFAAVLDSYGATRAAELTRENAEFVIAALTERGAR